MDRDIDPAFRRQQIIKRIAVSAIIVSALCALLVWGPGWISPSISRARIRTARVDTGPVESVITASGIVVPELEQVLSSPIDARVVKILKKPGEALARGEPIVELDISQSRLALEKIEQQIQLKQNQQAKIRLDLESTLNDLQSRWEIKNLEYQSNKANSIRTRGLYRQGLLSEEKLREVELLEEKVAFELLQLEESKRNARKVTATQIEGLELEMKTLEQERAEALRQLDLATARSDRKGVLTWVVTEEGATIQKGGVLARIADLSSFRVQATVSDVHTSRLSTGLPVSIRAGEDYLKGTLASIDPTISNGVITFTVALEDKSSSLLRSNLRVDVLVATDHKDRALRIRKGPFAGSTAARDVFVIRGDVAVRTPARFGIASFDHYEVVEGLIEGDEVIISDMSDYLHMKEVKLK